MHIGKPWHQVPAFAVDNLCIGFGACAGVLANGKDPAVPDQYTLCGYYLFTRHGYQVNVADQDIAGM